MKLLSIIIPTYNMEAYLGQCVESILRTPSLAAIEILIVNDGSTDRSLRIAKGYAERYTDTIRVIDKPNGNYGSTINAALAVAKGEYVKILDADDSFVGSRVASFITSLRELRGVDMVVTPFVEWNGKRESRVDYNIYSRKVYDYNKVYDADKVMADGAIRYFMMHSVCYRTEVLRGMDYRQTEGVSYTDQEWVFYPLFAVQTISFLDIPLYRYNLAREGQTMDPLVQMRSIKQLQQVAIAIASYFELNMSLPISDVRREFLRNFVADRFRILYRKYLLQMSAEQFSLCNFAMVHNELSEQLKRCEIEEFKVPVNNLLRVDLFGGWVKHGRRYNALVLWMLCAIDGVMKRVYSLIYR